MSTPTDPGAIVHPADPTRGGGLAFAHALKIALRRGRPLSLLEVTREGETATHKSALRPVLEMLASWRLLPANADPRAMADKLGLQVTSVSVPARSVSEGILDHLESHPCELAVLATHPRKTPAQWLSPSLQRRATRRATTMVLFLNEAQRGFVDVKTGDLRLRRVLMPIDDRIDATEAAERAADLAARIAPGAELTFLYVGERPPRSPLPDVPMVTIRGPVVPTILDVATRRSVDLIVLPTAGRHGLMGALRGSVTQDILADARWPVLSVPAAS